MPALRVARKSILSHFASKWADGLLNGLPESNPVMPPVNFTVCGATYKPKAYYRDIPKPEALPNGEHFVRFTLSNLATAQKTLRGNRTVNEGSRYNTPGIATAQLFFSNSNYTTEEEDLLTAIVVEMFLGKEVCDHTIRKVTVKELPEEEKYFRTNVSIEYDFDTVVT